MFSVMHFECHAMFPMHSTTRGYALPVEILFMSQKQKGFRFLYTFKDLDPILDLLPLPKQKRRF